MDKQIANSIKAGVMGGGVSFIVGFFVNYAFIPVPVSEISNAIGNGFTGLFSGFMSGFIGLLMYLRKSEIKR